MSPLKLYYSPLACSLSCHIALEESGLAYGLELVDTKSQANRAPDYLLINPLGKVPALAVDGRILTESAAILSYVADSAPAKSLLPPAGTLARAFAHEWLNFLSSTVHISFRPVFRPERLAQDAGCIEEVRSVGVGAVVDALRQVDAKLGDRQYALGDSFSLVDAYLLVFYLWSRREQLVSHMPQLPALQRTAQRVMERAAVKSVLKVEGVRVPVA